ncbi:MAG TPA: hypothetical protein VJX67_26680 [Blastocatellia bacterium]|nr:hypothetical protein [Blastocatellia bacterium]
MTLQQAIREKLSIAPGQKIRTFGGWCRHDKVLLDGHEIGRIQTRRAKDRTEFITVTGNAYVVGYDVDWLVQHGKGD